MLFMARFDDKTQTFVERNGEGGSYIHTYLTNG